MKNSLLFLFLSILALPALSQNWTILSAGTVNDLNTVCFVSADTGYVAGNKTTLLKTMDGGVNWESLHLNLPDTLSIKSVFFRNAEKGWVVGQTGFILRTTDGGTTWLSPGALMPYIDFLNAVTFPTEDTGYVVGGSPMNLSGYLCKTLDAGVFWNNGYATGTPCLNSVFFTDGYQGCAVGDQGIILKTFNGGVTWSTVPAWTTKRLNSVFFFDKNNGCIVGDSGLILRTVSGGADWIQANSGTSEDLVSVYFYDQTTGYVAGENGTILNTADGGALWAALWSGTPKRLTSICFPAPDIGFAVGDSGTIIKTTNGGGVGITYALHGVKKIRAFPNPVAELLTIEMSTVPEQATVTVTNVEGVIVYRSKVSSDRFNIDFSGFPPSVYCVSYMDHMTTAHLKIIRK